MPARVAKIAKIGAVALAAIAAIAPIACTADETQFLGIDRDASTKAIIFALTGGDTTSLQAIDATMGVAPVRFTALVDGAQLTALHYSETLEQLMIEPGPIALVDRERPSRALPEPASVFASMIVDQRAGDWQRTELNPALRELRIAPLDAPRCVAMSGCFDRQRPGVCVTPCPEPTPIDPPHVPMPPADAAFPQTICARGWSLEQDGELMLCVPPPRVDPQCARGFVQRLTDADCAPIDECPPGDWPPGLPQGTLYVRPGTPGTGDGTFDAPYATIGEALFVALPGSTIALAKGTYREEVSLEESLNLVGACVAETSIEPVDPLDSPIHTSGAPVYLAHLSVRAGKCALSVDAGETTIDHVLFEGDAFCAVTIARSIATLNHVHARGTFYDGVIVGLGSTLTARELNVEAARHWGVVIDRSHAQLENVVVRELPGIAEGRGLVTAQSTVTVSGLLVEDAPQYGVELAFASTATIADLLVRGTGTSTNASRAAVLVEPSSEARIDRALLEHNASRGLALFHGRARVYDLVVRDVVPKDNAEEGIGVLEDSRLVAARIYEQRVGAGALRVADGASATVEDVRVVDVIAPPEAFADGLLVLHGGALEAARVYMEFRGQVAIGGEGRISLQDITVFDVSTSTIPERLGISGGFEATLDVSRAHVEAYQPVRVGLASHAKLEDLFLRAIGHRVDPGKANIYIESDAEISAADVAEGGYGVYVAAGQVTLEDVSIHEVRNGGLLVLDEASLGLMRVALHDVRGVGIDALKGALVSGTHVEIADTKYIGPCGAECDGTAIFSDHFRPGNGELFGSTVELSTFRIHGSAANAAFLSTLGRVIFHDGEVSENGQGLKVQALEYDLGLLLDRVRYRDNRSFLELIQE